MDVVPDAVTRGKQYFRGNGICGELVRKKARDCTSDARIIRRSIRPLRTRMVIHMVSEYIFFTERATAVYVKINPRKLNFGRTLIG